MNILLNNYCNLNCEYCFANHVLEKDRIDVSLDDFGKILQFLKRSNVKNVNLIGGEPTLHPYFEQIIDMVLKDNHFKQILLFTNGIFKNQVLDKLINFSGQKTLQLLINYNNISQKRLSIVNNNIISLKDFADITLGINFFKPDQDFSYIINACNEYKIKHIRWSLVVPNNDLTARSNVRDYYFKHKGLLVNFLTECLENEIIPHVDCNNFPLCLLGDDELKTFAMSSEVNLKVSVCQPVVDVLPNLKAIRCFVFSDHEVNLLDYQDLDDLTTYFEETIDSSFNGRPLFCECSECQSYQYRERSCACLKFNNKTHLKND